MVKKGKIEESGSKDLTRIEDLSEFLHEEDPSLEEQFESFQADDAESPPEIPTDDILKEETPTEELSFENNEEFSLDDSTEMPTADVTDELTEEENTAAEDEFLFSEAENVIDDLMVESSFDEEIETPEVEIPVSYQPPSHQAEKFDDVKNFAQNFSYGQVQGGGNPPYSIIVRHIKYEDDASDILDLLKEFNFINTSNEAETKRALEFGSLLIPQISEYSAIVLAHKLRRFDLDLEVGLSDEVHPSKDGESNPRGLLKKESLKQNRIESLKLSELNNSIQDIIVSTSSSIPGFYVDHYIGVQTTFSIVEEAELERLQYVQKSKRENLHTFDYNPPEMSPETSEKIFQDYQNSFNYLYEDLTQQLKQKAFTLKANALLGLSFQLSPLQFDRSHRRVNAYQITCSATMAMLSKENT